MASKPAFATDSGTARYYEQRALEYDDWYTSAGVFAGRDRSGWSDEVAGLVEVVRGLPAVRTLDVACGTGFLTRHLTGFAVGLDQRPSMIAITQSRLPDELAVIGDALRLRSLACAGAFASLAGAWARARQRTWAMRPWRGPPPPSPR